MNKMRDIDLSGKCGSCGFYRQSGNTAAGWCGKKPAPTAWKFTYMRVSRSRKACKSYVKGAGA